MAYSGENRLKRIADVQALFKQHYQPGMVIEYVYNNHIYPAYKISRKTFYDYMNINVKAEMEKLQQKKEEKKQATQLTLL